MQRYQNTGGSGSQRPYSVNNPFRNASQTMQDTSLKQYETDEDFQNWVKQNQHFSQGTSTSPFNSQYYRPVMNHNNRSTSSFHSQRSSAFYEDDILNHYDTESSKENTYQGVNGNRLDFKPPQGIYRYVVNKKKKKRWKLQLTRSTIKLFCLYNNKKDNVKS